MQEKTARRSSATKKTAKKTTKKKAAKKTTAKKKKKTTTKKTGRLSGKPSKIDVDVDGNVVRASREIGGRTLILETGRMAKQADGAVIGPNTHLVNASVGAGAVVPNCSVSDAEVLAHEVLAPFTVRAR